MSSKPGPVDPAAMIRDWMTIWQSEVAAMGVDREMQENWARLAGAWAPSAAPFGPGHDPQGRPGADAATRPAAAADASDAEPGARAEIAFLRGELAGLRQRIEKLEARGRRPAGAGTRRPKG